MVTQPVELELGLRTPYIAISHKNLYLFLDERWVKEPFLFMCPLTSVTPLSQQKQKHFMTLAGYNCELAHIRFRSVRQKNAVINKTDRII